MTVPITGNLTETQRFPAPSLDGVAWQAARAGRQLRISASQKPLERDTQRRGPVLRKALPPRTPSNFHISHKNHWTTGKKMYRVFTSYGTTARSSCGRQATRALVRPVYQPIQTVGAEKDRTRRHPGPDGSGRSVGASRARDQNLRISHGGRRQSLLSGSGRPLIRGTPTARLPPKRRGTM